MLDFILSNIICYEYEKLVGRDQRKHPDMHGMQMNFMLDSASDVANEQEYPSVQLLIFAEFNYVGVYYRESVRDATGPNDDGDDRFTAWRRLSYHDSCWRSDGVDRFLHQFGPKINTLGWHGGIGNNEWYLKRLVTDEEANRLRGAAK